MSQHYSDPAGATNPYALPNIEVFRVRREWWWWPCFPGCLPDGEAVGPFATKAEALADARGQ